MSREVLAFSEKARTAGLRVQDENAGGRELFQLLGVWDASAHPHAFIDLHGGSADMDKIVFLMSRILVFRPM